jgi:hypothetical protein
MRAVFGVLSLLFVVAIVGFLAKKQLSAGVAPPVSAVPGAAAGAPPATPKQQVEQFKQAVDGAMQQPRPMPDEPK